MTYLTQSTISDDTHMRLRVAACAAENGCASDGIDPDEWMLQWRREWGASPGWDDAWESALASGNPEPGSDPAVITDAQINTQVQSMMPFKRVGDVPNP